ncbi:14477_t:CDS:2, partial [Racocetra persica]
MAQRCEHREWLDNAIRNNQIIKYNYNTFNEIRPIGHGTFGRVSSAISSKFERKVALKSVKINPDFTIELLVNEVREYFIHIGSHNNILEFYGIIEDESDIFILVLEYANNGTLKEYLCENFCILNWDDKLRLANQLADAIKFLHSHDIIHRDLHSDNVLIHGKIIKLSDFGNSKFITDPSIQLTKELGSMQKPIHGTPKDYVKIYEGLTNGIEVLSSASNSAPNINEVLGSAPDIDEESITFEYIDNNIEDSDKQFLRQLMQLVSNYINVPEEPKLFVNQIEASLQKLYK